ncbi:MAG: putative prenyl protease 1 [Bacteroidetes bacterium]|nr:putative prenyl protease 1 [Bacteroidota bacterium]
MKTWEKPVPAELRDIYDDAKFEKAKAYAKENNTVSTISGLLSLIILLSFLYFKGFAWVDGIARNISPNPIIDGLIFFGIIMFASGVFSMPFELYSTFVIEEKYGFNKMTFGTYVGDKVKTIVLTVILGGAIYALLAYLFQLLGDYFWIAGWAIVSGVSIFIAAFYTAVLLPIFNKLVPLESGSLRSQIESYASKVSFPLTNIMVMDGSKRSSKANAFFSGMGSRKSIVLYDTLINDMTADEITAVLAHEVGHYKKKHIFQSIAISVAQMGIIFFVFGWVARSPVMAEALGAKENSFYLALITFSMLYSPISTIIGLFMNVFSRKNEYEADAYARDTYSSAPLIGALKKLYSDQLGNPQPHPAYVFVNYSHPTLLQRIRAMNLIRLPSASSLSEGEGKNQLR